MDINDNQLYHLLNEAAIILNQMEDQSSSSAILTVIGYIQYKARTHGEFKPKLRLVEFSYLLEICENLENMESYFQKLINASPDNLDYLYWGNLFLFIHKEIRDKYVDIKTVTSTPLHFVTKDAGKLGWYPHHDYDVHKEAEDKRQPGYGC